MTAAPAGPLAALRIPGFRRWFATQVLSASGGLTQAVAVAWLVLQQTGRDLDVALVSAAMLLPVLLGGAVAGTLSDRFDRQRLLLLTQTLFAGLSGLLFVLALSHRTGYPLLLVLSLLTGVVLAVDGPARQLYVLDLVGTAHLGSAVSLYEVVLNASRVLGPSAGGALLALTGPAWCFLANALTYLPPLVVLLRNGRARGTGRVAVTSRGGGAAGPGTRGIREGLRHALRTPAIRACVVLAAGSGVLFNSTVLLPVLATRTFHLGAGGVGAFIAAFGVGALPGALAAARGGGCPSGRLIFRLAVLTGLTMLLTVIAPDAGLAFASIVVTGFVSIWFIAAANTFVQLQTPPSLRGRVMGVWTMALPGMNPVTGVSAGLLADAAGGRVAYAAAAGVFLAGAASGWRALRHSTSAGVPADPARTPDPPDEIERPVAALTPS